MLQSNQSVSHTALRFAFERLAHTCQHDGHSMINGYYQTLRFITAQGINSLTLDQIACSMILGSTFKNRPRDITPRYQDAMACVLEHGKAPLFITVTCDPKWPEIKATLGPNDKTCNCLYLIAQVFEAKSGNKQRAGCFDNEWRMNGELLHCCCSYYFS
ncbi:BZ3500_MvSof-1268-A1-R1_Chr6-2g08590 [Microbotryum saponariae]|uniref:BZ3500_MvSof-1268-A1-R1_Chr6-2g08590 protein n=1 Tax=Microbotryum saponariae TaxID=289078 RepID=A0A2X0MN80_9BASI|nr:BZ3500_MvSof-1268-A1-R1_Chr6-2g08590 [Microbotryum saponariae]SDA07862.1 BZ3501_MvSof-1269-A2-R1_Chr6-1g08299 [Microbotryum saponariae]